MRHFLFAAMVLAGLGAAEGANEPRPNVLILIADQWRAQAFGYAGDPTVKTPHLDALERESIDFIHAIASVPVCCPTRASLLTGQRALTHGVFLNDVPLAGNAVTLAKVLRAEGYQTGYVGKWHLNGDGRSAFIPRERRQGFDYWKALECTHDYTHSFYYGDGPEKLQWPGYDATAQTRDAQEYLRSRAANRRPFLLMLSWGPPHSPYGAAPEKYRALYDPARVTLRGNVPPGPDAAWRRDLAGYYAHCSALDDCAGALLQTLRETGLDRSTIVIFTSDHGDMLGSHGLSAKQKPFDESIRVPLLFRCPPALGLKARRLDAMITQFKLRPLARPVLVGGRPSTFLAGAAASRRAEKDLRGSSPGRVRRRACPNLMPLALYPVLYPARVKMRPNQGTPVLGVKITGTSGHCRATGSTCVSSACGDLQSAPVGHLGNLPRSPAPSRGKGDLAKSRRATQVQSCGLSAEL